MARTPVFTKPRISIAPTMAINAPLPAPPQPRLRVPEAATLITDSGRPIIRVGDSRFGPEMLSVTPPAQAGVAPRPMIGTSSGPVSMANGGDVLIGPNNPDAFDALYGVGNNTNVPGAGPSIPPPQPVISASPQTFDPLAVQQQNQQAVLDARRATLGASVNSLNSQGQVLTSEQGTFAPARNVIGANANVIGGQVAQTAGQRQLIGLQQGQNDQRRAETIGIQTAAADTADQAAVARAQSYRNGQQGRYAAAGLQPVEVATANGADGTPLPAGVRAKLQTSQQLLQAKSDNAEALRKLDETSAQLGVNLLGLDVDSLREVAAQAGISLDLAQQAVTEAKNRAGVAGLQEDQAKLGETNANINLDESQIRPAGQDVYTSPDGTSSYVTPLVKQQLEARDKRVFDATQPSDVLYRDPYNVNQPTYMSQADADAANAQYKRDFNLGQTVANDASRNQQQAAISGQRPYAGLSPSQITGFIRDGTFKSDASLNAAYQELIAQGQSPEAAQAMVDDAVRANIASKTSGGTEIVVPGFKKP